jgi:hypothetical protein
MAFLVYGGNSYAIPDSRADIELIPGVDIFDSLDEALAEFLYRKNFGETSEGLLCPVWDSEDSGGVLEEDSNGDLIDIHRPE